MYLKKIEWIKSSRRSIKEFPAEARYRAGSELLLVQEGKQPTNWKPISLMGPGVMEIRIHEPHEYRILCIAKFPEAIYVLHCFDKKTQKTSQRDINIARSAYVEVQRIRKG